MSEREKALVEIGLAVERAVCDEGVFSTDQSLAIQRAIMGAVIPLLNAIPDVRYFPGVVQDAP